jgi:hypothetical protein
MAWIFNVVEKYEQTVLRCSLDPLETVRVSEVPQWMFDPVACSHITSSALPIVDCEALRELKRLLTDKSLAAQLVVQAEHRPLFCAGGADATRAEPSTGRSTRSVSTLSKEARVGESAVRSPASDNASAGATTAATSTRASRRVTRTGGAR